MKQRDRAQFKKNIYIPQQKANFLQMFNNSDGKPQTVDNFLNVIPLAEGQGESESSVRRRRGNAQGLQVPCCHNGACDSLIGLIWAMMIILRVALLGSPSCVWD